MDHAELDSMLEEAYVQKEDAPPPPPAGPPPTVPKELNFPTGCWCNPNLPFIHLLLSFLSSHTHTHENFFLTERLYTQDASPPRSHSAIAG
eukprot:m.111460 g.111460  ORF g.111460 m.111460 type:complete len:91 (-) comp21369_c0_seq1:2180-2452(-)